MTALNWKSDLCVFCGVCCTDISEAPITVKDAARLAKHYDVPVESLVGPKKMLFQSENVLTVTVSKNGCCSALQRGEDSHVCTVYEDRPDICRNYVCPFLYDLEEYERTDGKVPRSNFFFEVPHEKVKKIAFDTIPRAMLTVFRFNFLAPHLLGKKKKPSEKFFPDLMKAWNSWRSKGAV